jgi:hypothetical protein
MAVCISISMGGRPGANERDLARVWQCSSSARRRRKAVVRSGGDIVWEMPNLAGQHERQPEASRSLPLSLKPTPSNNPRSPQPAPFSEADALEQPNSPDCGTFFLWVPSAALPLIRPSPFRPSRCRTISLRDFYGPKRKSSATYGPTYGRTSLYILQFSPSNTEN